MTEPEELRDKDWTVLHNIQQGNTDVQQITSATVLENHEVNYCFRKLDDLDLINVEKPDGMVTRVIDGQKRVFEAPKQAELTDNARHLLTQRNKPNEDYEDLTHRELVQRVHQLEQDITQLQQALKLFRKQVQERL
jgi:predicted transcriptional regulator